MKGALSPEFIILYNVVFTTPAILCTAMLDQPPRPALPTNTTLFSESNFKLVGRAQPSPSKGTKSNFYHHYSARLLALLLPSNSRAATALSTRVLCKGRTWRAGGVTSH